MSTIRRLSLFLAPLAVAAGVGLIATLVSTVGAAVPARHRPAAAAGFAVPGHAMALGLQTGLGTVATPPAQVAIEAPLAGTLTPVAVTSPDGEYTLYNTWRQLRPDDPAKDHLTQGIHRGDLMAIPALRVRSSTTGEDREFATGATSAAWSARGRIAFAQGSRAGYYADTPWRSTVVVRDRLDGRDVRWTTESGKYFVAGWAGESLLVYRESEGELLELLAIDRPGEVRSFGATALVAVSPDGAGVFLTTGAAVTVVDVRSGTEMARAESPLGADHVIYYAGDWRDDKVIAASTSGLVEFRVRSGGAGGLAMSRLLPVSDRYREGVHEPHFGRSSAEIIAWAPVRDARGQRGAVALQCDDRSGKCATSSFIRGRNVRPIATPPRIIRGGA